MSETKHTDGKWITEDHPTAESPFIAIRNIDSPRGKGQDGKQIAQLNNYSSWATSKGEGEANAKLIAAAPEMLEQLNKLCNVINHCMEHLPETWKKSVREKKNNAVEVIKKAIE